MNVLVYAGDGRESTGTPRIDHLSSLRQILFPKYAVSQVTSQVLLNEPWTKSCAMLVVTGDDYQDVAHPLGSSGTSTIQEFVRSGGSFLGINAGAFYGSKEHVIASTGGKAAGSFTEQHLGFFPGAFQGPYTQGQNATSTGAVGLTSRVEGQGSLEVYHRGGGVFIDASKFASDGVELMAEYNSLDKGAAVVYRQVGRGACILASPHLEIDPRDLTSDNGGSGSLQRTLVQYDGARVDLLKHCLQRLGLIVNTVGDEIPPLSAMHLSSANQISANKLMTSLSEYMQGDTTVDEHDIFRFTRQSESSEPYQGYSGVATSAPRESNVSTSSSSQRLTKHIIFHERGHPSAKSTPLFNHDVFFDTLTNNGNSGRTGDVWFGNHLLYGEVMESTNTILARNHKFLSALPTGFTALASLQTAGRGRGSNVWVSPLGCLLFSTCIRYPSEAYGKSPVVFVQYLAAMAVVRAVRSYAPGYEDFPIHIKWPNDIYVKVSHDTESQPQHAKIGGVLVQCSYLGGEYYLVAGVGVNTTNAAPTTSLRQICDQLNTRRVEAGLDQLEIISSEKLLARILQAFERLYIDFRMKGWDESLNDKYLHYWLHTGQIVTIEGVEGKPRGRIVGISHMTANLIVEELGNDERATGQIHELNPDGNSFDFFHGLLKTKD